MSNPTKVAHVSFVAVFLVLYLREKGYSIAEAGLLASLLGAGNVMAAAVACRLTGPAHERRSRLSAASLRSPVGVICTCRAPLVVELHQSRRD